MNLEQIEYKIRCIGEKLDLLLCIANPTREQNEEYPRLADIINRSINNQKRRQKENQLIEEYWRLKDRIKEIESDHPELII